MSNLTLIWRILLCFLQSMTLKLYPAEFSLAALICFVGMVGGGIVTLVAERNMKIWVIGWDSKLLAVVYSVIIQYLLTLIFLHIYSWDL